MRNIMEIPEVFAAELMDRDNDIQGYWISSLTTSFMLGYSDNCSMPFGYYIDKVRRLRMNTFKDIIVDADMLYATPDIAKVLAKELFHAGAKMIVVEEKTLKKVNSLHPMTYDDLNSVENVCEILRTIKNEVPGLLVSARIERLILDQNINEITDIMVKYAETGIDGFTLHYKDKDVTNLKLVIDWVRHNYPHFHVNIIPTTYIESVYDKSGKALPYFEENIDFSILGNNFSSNMIDHMSNFKFADLIEGTPKFKNILKDKLKDGTSTFILDGEYLNGMELYLADTDVSEYLEEGINIITKATGTGSNIINITKSVSEGDTILQLVKHIKTKYVKIAYSSVQKSKIKYVKEDEIFMYNDDSFGKVVCINTAKLQKLTKEQDITGLRLMEIALKCGGVLSYGK